MSSPDSSGSSASAARLGADGERVSERLGLHRQLLSKLAHSQALTGQDIESGYAQVTELMTTLLRVERGSVWRFDESGTQLECVDLFEWTGRRHSSGAHHHPRGDAGRTFRRWAQNRCIAATTPPPTPPPASSRSRTFRPARHWRHARRADLGRRPHGGRGLPRARRAAHAVGSSKKSCWPARWPTSSRASSRLRTGCAPSARWASTATTSTSSRASSKPCVAAARTCASSWARRRWALVLTRLRDQHVVLANERCAALFEVPLDEVVGQRTRDYYVTPEERDQVIGTLVEQGQLDSVLVRLKKRSG